MKRFKPKNRSFLSYFLFVLAGVLLAVSIGCNVSTNDQPVVPEEPDPVDEQALLDNTFRIDIGDIDVIFDYVPAESYIDARASVTFRMRAGQSRPVIHFDPAFRSVTPDVIRLNGEALNFSDTSDVRAFDVDGTTQQGLEFQRDLAGDVDHTLEMEYRLTLDSGLPYFYSDSNDVDGNGGEELFPTINTPHELARHRLTFRVHGDTPYRCIGSGFVQALNAGARDERAVREWLLDTEREVASYTVMFVLLPEADVVYEERTLNGVDVRIMAYVGGASIDSAFNRLEPWLPELEENLGPFPMPRGLSVFLTNEGWGMEYYGGTITGLGVLEHEVFHMYFACSTVASTYRDSWWDEAINMWYELSVNPDYPPISEYYTSNIVSGRTPVSVGFDTRAYDEGARIMQAVAVELGGRDAMIGFLRYIHENYSFSPFNTFDFLDYLGDYAGIGMRDRFTRWLYNGQRTYYDSASTASSDDSFKKVDMTPPETILRKYIK